MDHVGICLMGWARNKIGNGRFPGRARRVKNMNEVPLPLHLELEILRWLPTKSVLRFRCVQKSWNEATREQIFIDAHLRRAAKETSLFIRLLSEGKGSKTSSIGVVSDPRKRLDTIKDFAITPLISSNTSPCHGLVCFSMRYDYPVNSFRIANYICNPSTEEYLKLPRRQPVKQGGNASVRGLGFDPNRNQLKMVMFHRVAGNSTKVRIAVSAVTLPAGEPEPWLSLDHDIPDDMGAVDSGVLVNARLHWFVVDRIEYNNNIDSGNITYMRLMSFDVHDEQIRDVPVQKVAPHKNNEISFLLTELKGSLALFRIETPSDDVRVWVMNEYGKNESWTLQFSLPFRSPSVRPALHLSAGEEDGKLLVCSGHAVCSYDPTTQGHVCYGPQLKEFDDRKLTGYYYSSPFSSSLVSLRGAFRRRDWPQILKTFPD